MLEDAVVKQDAGSQENSRENFLSNQGLALDEAVSRRKILSRIFQRASMMVLWRRQHDAAEQVFRSCYAKILPRMSKVKRKRNIWGMSAGKTLKNCTLSHICAENVPILVNKR